jgi:hypothetical protein
MMDRKQGRKMPYTIVFETRNTREVCAADATTANQALKEEEEEIPVAPTNRL